MTSVTIEPHPLLELGAFITVLPEPLGKLESPTWLTEMLSLEYAAPMTADATVRSEIRDLLRVGGHKPAGRGKPASEFLRRAESQGSIHSINLVVDVCNVVSLHSGLPVSVVDLDRATGPFRVAMPDGDASYVFNPAGQVLQLGGLLSLFDTEGPCANAVKDSQRTKTHENTTRTLSVVWGSTKLPQRTQGVVQWYMKLLSQTGAMTQVLPQLRSETAT